MEALSGHRTMSPNFGTLVAYGRRLWVDLVKRDWRQVPISVARRLIDPLPDRVYLTLGHLFYFGRWPNYAEPRTINEHIQEYMMRCRDPLLRVAADKVACRDYVAAKAGAEYLVPMLGVWDSADEVPLETLARPCVLKPTASSGAVMILRPGDNIDPKEVRRVLRGWLKRDYSRLHREWCYAGLPRRLMAEEMVMDDSGETAPLDYKAYVIGGAVRYFHLDRGRFTHHTRNLYYPDWTLMPARWSLHGHPPDPAPPRLAEMVALAEHLARPFEFLRVDLFAVGSKIYVGELTNYPGAGFEKFIPGEYADIAGAYWKRRVD
jgi:hypothetical protein